MTFVYMDIMGTQPADHVTVILPVHSLIQRMENIYVTKGGSVIVMRLDSVHVRYVVGRIVHNSIWVGKQKNKKRYIHSSDILSEYSSKYTNCF